MTNLERDALPGALLDPLIARLKPLQGWFSPGDMNAVIAALTKCREALLGEAPAGWKLVPIEPTQEMLEQIKFLSNITDEAMTVRYRAMLAAAPLAACALPGEGE